MIGTREQRQALLDEYENKHYSLEWLLARFVELDKPVETEPLPAPQASSEPVSAVVRSKPNRPNPQALAALADRLNWFLAKREAERREYFNAHPEAHWVGADNDSKGTK